MVTKLVFKTQIRLSIVFPLPTSDCFVTLFPDLPEQGPCLGSRQEGRGGHQRHEVLPTGLHQVC